MSSSMKPRGIYFNSRPCGRGDLWRQSLSIRALIFQFTPLREGRRAACAPADALHHFNSRPCGRGDLPPVHHGQREKRISIHAPAGGATGDHDKTRLGQDHFNSRPCGRGDAQQSQPTAPKPISIHAPAGGATACWYVELLADTLFQFTPLREGRPEADRTALHQQIISIHAPAGGATQCPRWNSTSDIYFNSRPCGRGDLVFLGLPQGYKNFNSRPCGRGDQDLIERQIYHILFQFTPLREGRLAQRLNRRMPRLFQFTPLREGRRCQCSRESACRSISIHAPAGGATF